MNTTTDTPLAEWLRAAGADQRLRMAELAGTSVNYLYQLAGCYRKQVKADLAFRIEDATKTLHAESGGKLPIIAARTIATMCMVAVADDRQHQAA